MNEHITEGELQPEGRNSNCPVCYGKVHTDDAFCEYCGYPLKGSIEEQNFFRSHRLIKEDKLEDMERKVRTASTTLYILAGLSVIGGIILAARAEPGGSPGAILLVCIILSSIYIGLGYWCRVQPIPAIICGLILYVTVTIINIMMDSSMAWKSIVINILVIAFLVNGLYSAYEAQRIKKELHIV